MVPSASVLACRREERVQKAVSVDHHGPGDARLSAVLNPLSGPKCDYVIIKAALFNEASQTRRACGLRLPPPALDTPVPRLAKFPTEA